MAGQSRTLKLSILADVDQLKKSLAQANGDVDDSSSKMGEFSKKAGLAFAAAGAAAAAYAIKIGVDGVKAAIEDEAAQVKLANALKSATGATEAQIKATENQILKMSLATGVSDEKLRPALQRIALSTGDLSKAQDLLSVALDVSTSTGKPLEAVANAIGKAYDGNTAALGKLGIGLSSAELKTMSFTDVQTKLTDLFGGAAAANAETYQGRLDRLKVTFDEAKETIGYKLLPIIQKLVDFIVSEVVPALGKFAGFFKPITDAIENNKDSFMEFIGFLQKYVLPVLISGIGGAFKVVGDIAGGVINVIGAVIGYLNTLISGAIAGINALIGLYNNTIGRIPGVPDIPKISAPSISVPTPNIPKVTNPSAPTVSVPSVSGGSTSSSGGSTSGGGVSSAAMGAAIAGGFTDSQNAARLAAMGGGGFTDSQNAARINLTVNGAIDAEGTARTIVNVLNDSFFRGTGGAGALQAI
jgi:phage-related protein